MFSFLKRKSSIQLQVMVDDDREEANTIQGRIDVRISLECGCSFGGDREFRWDPDLHGAGEAYWLGNFSAVLELGM
jgi:hypothetical protein